MDLDAKRLSDVLSERWSVHAVAMRYLAVGGGSHHWKVTDEDGRLHFVTVDDLDDKDWMADTRDAAFEALGKAFNTAAMLREVAGLEFVVAPARAGDGGVLHRVGDRYTISVFPFLGGSSNPFGPYTDTRVRGTVVEMVAALHQATSVVRCIAPVRTVRFGGRRDLEAVIVEPGRRWLGGPFSERAHRLVAPHADHLGQLVARFDRMVDVTAPVRADAVITHGEPHPANVMSVDGRLLLIDWDTVALSAPERDLWLLASAGSEDVDRYRQLSGRGVDPRVLTLYQLRWYLDDLASAVRLFRNPHRATADTRRWCNGLPAQLQQLSRWLEIAG